MAVFNGNHKRWINGLLEKNGISPDAVDIRAYWDSELSYMENKHEIMKKLDITEKAKNSEEFREENHQKYNNYYQEEIDKLFRASENREGDYDELLTEIKKFAPHTEVLTLSTLIAINQGINVINLSRAGLGKSRSTVELFEKLSIPFVKVSGRITPKRFFEKLETISGGGVMVIDESATLLYNDLIRELLLSALWSGRVSWETTRETREVVFEGTIIFNTNTLAKDGFTTALKDRVIFNKLILDQEEIKDKIMSRKSYEFDEEVWSKIKNNVFTNNELSDEQEEKIWGFIERINVKSVRDEWRIRKISKGLNNILGNINYLKNIVGIDRVYNVLTSLELKRSEKVKRIAMIRRVSKRQARNIVKYYEDTGEWK